MPPVTPALEPLRRIAAYAVATDPDGRVLLVRASSRSGTPGVWSLPGGAVDHGEDPNHTVVRETAAETGLSVAFPGPDGLHRAQRFAAYAIATDADQTSLLLTRIAAGYPGEGCWHLPGGGTDYGEQPGTALIRELVEETGQQGRLIELLGVASHRDAASLGPEGYPIDWHGVRAFYRVFVDAPTEVIVKDVGGSTSEACWMDLKEVARL